MPRIYEFNDFIKETFDKESSVLTCVEGPNGSGKTEFNLLMMERIHDLGIGARFGSNMPIPEALKPAFKVDFIEDFQTLEATCRMLNPEPTKKGMKKYFFFLSELGKFIPRDEAWKNAPFIQKLQTVRKYGLSLLSDAIDRVDGRVLAPSFFSGRFEKPFPDTPQYAEWEDFRNGRKMKFKDIPRCETWFDTYYSANFYMTPQVPEDAIIPMNREHEIVREYMKHGSWKKAGIHPQEGKRAQLAVNEYHFKYCLPSIHEESTDKAVVEPSSTE